MEVPDTLASDIQDPKPAPQPVVQPPPALEAVPAIQQPTGGQLLAQRWIAEREAEKSQQLQNFRTAVSQDPQLYAKKVAVSQQLGLDPNNPDQDWKVAEQLAKQRQAEAMAFDQKYPQLSAQMRQYDFAAQAYDDLENLQRIEGFWQWVGENYSRGRMMVERGEIGTRIAMGWSTQADLDRLEEMKKAPRLPEMSGLLYGMGGGTAEVVGQMSKTLPASLAAAGTASAVAAVAPPLAIVSAPTAFLLTTGAQTAAIEGGNAYLDYLESGYGEEEARTAALGVGIINGAAETVLGKYALKPFQQLGGKLGRKVMPKVFKPQTATTSLGQAAMAYLKGVGAEVGTEVFQEITQIAGGEAAKAFSRPELDQLMATPQGRQQIYDRIGEIASKTVLSMMVLGLPGPMANFVTDMKRAEQANIDTQVLKAMVQGTNDSRLTERNPELARQFQESVQGQAVEEVFINSETLRSRLAAIDEAATAEGKLQKSAFDVLRDLLPEVSNQLQAVQGQNDMIRIKSADLTTKLGRSEMLSALMGDIRIDPYGMSENEVKQFSGQIQKRAGEMQKSISEKAQQDKEWRDSANRVRDMQAQQIRQAGRSALEARIGASLYSVIVQRMAMLEGVTPEQWHAAKGMTTMGAAAQPAAAVQPPAWLSQMAAPEQAQPTQEVAAAEPQAAPAQPTVQPIDQAKTLLADPSAQITPEQRAELEQYVQQAESQPLRSITPEQDTAYLAAVEAGDLETAQRMVDEAAKRAGYKRKLWHGTAATTDVVEAVSSSAGDKEQQLFQELRDIGAKFGFAEDVAYMLERQLQYFPDDANQQGITQEVATRARSLEESLQKLRRKTRSRPVRQLEFDVFNFPSDGKELGVHLGNQGQAEMFGDAFPFFVDLRKPLRLPDLGTWGYQSVMREARKAGVSISESEYESVFNASDNNAALRELLISKGYDGVVYKNEAEGTGDSFIVFAPRQAKLADPVTRDAAGNVIPLSQRFDQTKESILYSQQPEAGVGGTYSRLMRRTVLNQGPNGARETTWFHELMHFMFDTHADMIARGVATEQMRADFMELLRFAKFEGTLEEYLALPSEKQRVIHETVAYSWEAWLLEGQSPSLSMTRIFSAIRKFFVDVWKQLSGINEAYKQETGQDLPGLTPEVRAVFRRMVAAEDQIKLAEATRAAVPLFLDKETWTKLGNPAEDWDKYRAAERDRIDEAVTQLTRRSMTVLGQLHGTFDERLAKLQKEAAGVREAMRDEATAEVQKQRVYRLRDFLADGTERRDTGEVSEQKAAVHGLNREALTQMPLAANVVMTDLNQQVEAARILHEMWLGQEIRPLMRMPEVRASGSGNVKQTQNRITNAETKLAKLAANAPERVELEAKLKTLRDELAKRSMVAEERAALEAQKDVIRAENDEIRKANAEIDAKQRETKEALDAAIAAQKVGLRKVEAEELRRAKKHKLAQYLTEDGLDPAQVAEQFGYADTAEMLQDLLKSPEMSEAVENELDRRMLRDYEDLSSPEALEEAVTASLHNEANTRWLTMELNALQRAQRMGDNRPEAMEEQSQKEQLLADMRADLDALNNRLAQEKEANDLAAVAATEAERESLREAIEQVKKDADGALSMRIMRASARMAAEQALSGKKISEIRPDLFAAAERRSSRDALARLTENDLPGAIQAKRDQLLQNQMAQEAQKIRAYVQRTTKWFNAFFRKKDTSLARNRSLEHIYAIRAILLAYGFGGSTARQAAKAQQAAEFMTQLQKYEPARYAEINALIEKAKVRKMSFRDLTVDEFKVLDGTLRTLWEEAKQEKTILAEGKRVAVEEIEKQVADRAAEIAPKGPRPGQKEALTPIQTAIRTFQGILSSMRRAQSVFDEFDGKLPGVFTKYFWRPIQEAVLQYRAARDKYHAQFVAILQKVAPYMNNRIEDSWAITEKHIGYKFKTMQELVAALTHIGNLSNKSKLTVGGRGKGFEWAVYDEKTGIVNTSKFDAMIAELAESGILREEHFDAAQEIWNLNEEMKPGIQRVYRMKYGQFMDEVKATPFTITFQDGKTKTYAGGYVPAKVDREIVYDLNNPSSMAEVEQQFRDAVPVTGWGFTIARMNRYMKPLDLDLSRQFQHIEFVQRFVNVQPALWGVTRLLRSDVISGAFNSIDPTVIPNTIMPWLEKVASQRTGTPSGSPWFDSALRTVRNRAGMAIMFGNLSNTVQQITGFSLALLKVKPSYLFGALRRIVLTSGAERRAAYEFISTKSLLMNQRFRTQIFQLQEDMNEVLLNPSKFDKAKSYAKKHAYFMQQTVQNVMDAVVWSGAYEQALAAGVAETEAIARADAAVTMTQGGTQPELVARVEGGTEFVRTFTQFTNYFNMMFNLNYGEFAKLVRESGWRSNKGQLFSTWVMGMAAPTIVAAAIANAFSGKLDDEDDDGYAGDLAWFGIDALMRGTLSMIPGGSAIGALTINRLDDVTYNDQMLNTPVAGALTRAFGGTFALIEAAASPDKDVTGRKIRDALTMLDLLAGLPVSGIASKAGYAIESATGVQENYNFLDALRGSLTGTAAPGNRQK